MAPTSSPALQRAPTQPLWVPTRPLCAKSAAPQTPTAQATEMAQSSHRGSRLPAAVSTRVTRRRALAGFSGLASAQKPVDACQPCDPVADVEVRLLLVPLRVHVAGGTVQVGPEKFASVCDGRPDAVQLAPILTIIGGN